MLSATIVNKENPPKTLDDLFMKTKARPFLVQYNLQLPI